MQETGEPNRDWPDMGPGETRRSSGALPDQRLSPVLNPLLASQLGRWAEIYYTTPPEKRDEAVGQLLRELEAEAETGPITSEINQAAPPVEAAAPVAEMSQSDLSPPSEQRAAVKLLREPTLDESTAEGFSIPSVQNPGIDLPDAELSQVELPVVGAADIDLKTLELEPSPASFDAKALSETQFSQEDQDAASPWPRLDSVAASSLTEPDGIPTMSLIAHLEEEEIQGEADLHASENTQLVEATDAPVSGALSSSDAPHQTEADPSVLQFRKLLIPAARPQWISPLLGVAALLVVGFVVLLSTLRHKPAASASAPSSRAVSGQLQQASQARAPEARTPAREASQEARNAVKAELAPTLANRGSSASSASQPTSSQVEKSAAEKSVIERPETEPPSIDRQLTEKPTAESSDPDLAAGLQYLRGDPATRDSAKAAKYLWKSVGRQNGRALVELAGLYAKGDGVIKNCDQAKILLRAASHHKLNNMGAALETLRQSGCE